MSLRWRQDHYPQANRLIVTRQKEEGLTAHRRKSFLRNVAGVLYEARQREFARLTERVMLKFAARGTALVPARAVRGARLASIPLAAVGA
jgi:hypothetical protein